MTPADLEPLLQTPFHCKQANVTLTLAEVTRKGQAPPKFRAPFALVFTGPAGLPQATYTLVHETLGENDIFLVPIAAGKYEAVFG